MFDACDSYIVFWGMGWEGGPNTKTTQTKTAIPTILLESLVFMCQKEI